MHEITRRDDRLKIVWPEKGIKVEIEGTDSWTDEQVDYYSSIMAEMWFGMAEEPVVVQGFGWGGEPSMLGLIEGSMTVGPQGGFVLDLPEMTEDGLRHLRDWLIQRTDDAKGSQSHPGASYVVDATKSQVNRVDINHIPADT